MRISITDKYIVINIIVGFFFLLNFIFACNNPTQKIIPSEINKRVIISTKCNKVIYSSNEGNFFSPYIINFPFSLDSITVTKIPTEHGADFFSEDISCDCNFLSLVSEDTKERTFDIYLYDIKRKHVISITNSV